MSDPSRYRADEALRLGIITPAEHAYFVSKMEDPQNAPVAAPTSTPTSAPTITTTNTPTAAPIQPAQAVQAQQASVEAPTQASPQAPAQAPIAPPTAEPDESPPIPPERFRIHKSESAFTGRTLTLLFAMSIIPILMIIGALWLPSDITGNAVINIPHQVTNESIPVTEAVTGVHATGVLVGEGNATLLFVTDTAVYNLGTIQADSGAPRTDKPSYHSGDLVGVEHAPAAFSAYFDDGASSNAVDIPFNASVNGTLLLVANESGSLTTYRLPIIIGDVPRMTNFTGICGDACSISPTNGTIRVDASSATVEGLVIETDAARPSPPTLTAGFAPITVNETTSIDLNAHFADPQGGALSYAVAGATYVDATISGNLLTLTPLADGTQSIIIYASNAANVTSATMSVTAVMPQATIPPAPAENATTNTTENTTLTPPALPPTPPANESVNATALNATDTNATLDCSNPNPNLRPLECLQENATKYFNEPDKYWENLDRIQVAKVNALGNMLITGSLVEHSGDAPGPRDFSLGYTDNDGNYVATVWVDTAGNLHLKGTLHEEQLELAPSPGSYSIGTRRSLYLVYADMGTGDLFLRGNLIPNRRSLG